MKKLLDVFLGIAKNHSVAYSVSHGTIATVPISISIYFFNVGEYLISASGIMIVVVMLMSYIQCERASKIFSSASFFLLVLSSGFSFGGLIAAACGIVYAALAIMDATVSVNLWPGLLVHMHTGWTIK